MAALSSIAQFGASRVATFRCAILKKGWTDADESFRRRRMHIAPTGTCRTPEHVTQGWRRMTRKTVCRAASSEDYMHCKAAEDAVKLIMTDVIKHCLNTECDVMRNKVLDQMGKGLGALFRVTVSVATESTAPISNPVPATLLNIEDSDLEQVRRMIQLTSLPFNSTSDEDFKQLMKMLKARDGGGRRLTMDELSLVFDRLGSDLVQCLSPLAMCFPELPLWAKHRALLLPAELAEKVAFSLITGPSRTA